MARSDTEPHDASAFHVPVLLAEVLETLDPQPGMTVIDATLGGGGHARALAERIAPTGRLIGFDRDPEAIAVASRRLEGVGCRVDIVQASFSEIDARLRELGLRPTDERGRGVDRILADIGVSSHQLDTAARGFSFADPGAPLDMRMGPGGPSALELLREIEPEALAEALREGGDVPRARSLARAMCEDARAGLLETAGQLAALCERILPRRPPGRKRIHPATTVFQALRILVNREFDALETLLEAAPRWLRPGGRLGIIAFHSGEDRRVKHALRRLAGREPRFSDPRLRHLPIQDDAPAPLGRELTRRPLTASDEELARNPRARSAKLRVFELAE